MDFVFYSYIKWCFCISVSNSSLLIYKNTTDIFISVSHSIALINSLIRSSSFLRIHLYFLHMWSCSLRRMTVLLLPLWSLQFFFFLIVLAVSSRAILTRNDENKQHCFISYLSTIKYDVSFKFWTYAIHETEKVLCWEFLSWMNVQFWHILFLHLLRGKYVFSLILLILWITLIYIGWFLNV